MSLMLSDEPSDCGSKSPLAFNGMSVLSTAMSTSSIASSGSESCMVALSSPPSPPLSSIAAVIAGGGSGGGSKNRRYKCKKCDHLSVSKEDFWKHKGDHIKPEKRLKCDKCMFVTEYKHHLEYHNRNHDGKKPFKCSKCDYSCVNKSMLNSHMKSHSSVYQFQCKDCNYATKYCHSLKQHLRKNKHAPSPVLNLDGSVNPYPIIDVYGTRRGPRPKKSKSSLTHLSPTSHKDLSPAHNNNNSILHESKLVPPSLPPSMLRKEMKSNEPISIPSGAMLKSSLTSSSSSQPISKPPPLIPCSMSTPTPPPPSSLNSSLSSSSMLSPLSPISSAHTPISSNGISSMTNSLKNFMSPSLAKYCESPSPPPPTSRLESPLASHISGLNNNSNNNSVPNSMSKAFQSLSSSISDQERLFGAQPADLPLIAPLQDLSLLCPKSQALDYMRNMGMAMPFLCIPLFTNVLRPGIVNPTGLIRNIPSAAMQSQLADNEEDYDNDEASSDIEESFPLDLTRNNNNKNKTLQIIPPISNGRRDNKAVKFLID